MAAKAPTIDDKELPEPDPDATIRIHQRKSISFRKIASTILTSYPRRTIVCLSLFAGQAFLYNAVVFAQADTGAIITRYPTDQLMRRVSDRFVQQRPGRPLAPPPMMDENPWCRRAEAGEAWCGSWSPCDSVAQEPVEPLIAAMSAKARLISGRLL